MLNISIDTSGLRRMIDQLRHADYETPIARAINRAAESACTAISRELADATGLGVREVREKVQVVQHASPGNLYAKIRIAGEHVSLSHFDPHQTKAGVSARPWNKPRVFPHTFLARGEVFVRKGKARLPIKKLSGPSLAVEFERNDLINLVQEVVDETMDKRLRHELAQSLRNR